MTTHTCGGMRATLLATAVLALGLGLVLEGQGRGGRGAAPPVAPKAGPIDLTGNWVSVVGTDWRWRMVMPPKGDFSGVPITEAARKVALAWDPDKDEAAGEQCRGFGAPGLMRIPGRLRITWQDDTTLRVDTDAGTQTRLLRFGAPQPSGKPSWQGESAARWNVSRGQGAATDTSSGNLEVITRNLRPGYLLRNGVPYSAGTVLTENWHVFREPDGTDWLAIMTRVEDPTHLQAPYQTTQTFKRERDGSKWDPTPCSAKW